MMTAKEILAELKLMGNAATKKVHVVHGAPEPLFGVKVGDLKKIEKKVKKNYELSLELFETGNSDAMYLAGLISDPAKMTKKDLQNWAEKSTWYMLSEYAVAWTVAESPFAWELANKWIQSKEEKMASTGWSVFSSYVAITPDPLLDKDAILSLLNHIEKNIHKAPDRVRKVMNMFLISAGGYIPSLTDAAKKIAAKIGVITVIQVGTACKVPPAKDYIDKMIARGVANKKKKSAKC